MDAPRAQVDEGEQAIPVKATDGVRQDDRIVIGFAFRQYCLGGIGRAGQRKQCREEGGPRANHSWVKIVQSSLCAVY